MADELADTMRPPPPASSTILLVDDQGFARRALARALREVGFEVREAADAHEALALVEDDPSIRAVVTDLAMPGRSGIQLLRDARRARPDLPVVLMSGYVVDHDVAQARAAGALGCLHKPFSLDQLVPLLYRALTP